MQRYNDIIKQSEVEINTPRHYRRMPFLAAILLTLATLACGFVEGGSRSVSGDIVLNRLPTLTRTPLPTLTPTASSASVAVALAAESFETAPAPASQPENTSTAPNVSATLSASLPADTAADASTAPDMSVVTENAGITDTSAPGALLDASTVLTDTPTSAPTVTPTETPVPTSIPTETPLPTSTLIPTATSTPLPKDWLFTGMQKYPDPNKDRLLLYGNLVNNTDLPQELISIVGTFLDEQGDVIASTGLSDAYWPGFVVSPGGSMPFELEVKGIESAADYTLSIKAEPSSEVPREDFEFAEVNQWMEADEYCIGSTLRNSGGRLEEYLMIAAVLYDSQDQVINFSDYGEFGVGVGDDGQTVEICVDPPNQAVARYKLRAWGR